MMMVVVVMMMMMTTMYTQMHDDWTNDRNHKDGAVKQLCSHPYSELSPVDFDCHFHLPFASFRQTASDRQPLDVYSDGDIGHI